MLNYISNHLTDYIRISCKGNNSSFVILEFNSVNSTPTTNGINISLKKYTIGCRSYSAKNFNIVSKH